MQDKNEQYQAIHITKNLNNWTIFLKRTKFFFGRVTPKWGETPSKTHRASTNKKERTILRPLLSL